MVLEAQNTFEDWGLFHPEIVSFLSLMISYLKMDLADGLILFLHGSYHIPQGGFPPFFIPELH